MHLTKEMDNQLLQLRREYPQPSQSPLSLTSDSWDPYMLHEELKLFMAAPGRLRNAISWKGFTNFKALWIFVIYPQISKGCQQSMAMSRVSRLYSIASGATWPDRKGDGKVTLLTVHGAKTAVWRHRKRLPKSRPIAKGFDAILLHCHLRCDFVFACSAQSFFWGMHVQFAWYQFGICEVRLHRLIFILHMTNTAKNSRILWHVEEQALTAAVQLKEFGSSASSSCMASSKSNAACVVAPPRLEILPSALV